MGWIWGFRDPAVTEEFQAVRLPIDIAEFHAYAVDWTADRADFFVDGNRCAPAFGHRPTRCS